MRVLTVILSALSAILLSLWAYAAGSALLAFAAALFVVVTIVSARDGDKRAAQAHAASALASTPPVAPAAEMREEPVAAELPRDAGHAEPASLADVVSSPPSSDPTPRAVALEAEAAPQLTVTPAETVEIAPVVEHEDVPAVRTPFSVQPTVVLMSLYDAASERYDALAAHLWLVDQSTETLRLIAAFGPSVPDVGPVSLGDEVLGGAARSGRAVFAAVAPVQTRGEDAVLWRYAVPVGTPEMRGVAAVDIAAAMDEEPSSFVLNEISAILRGSLTAAVAIHISKAEMETAVQLLRAAEDLTAGVPRDELFSTVLARAMEVADASTGSVMLPDPATGALRIVASKGLPADVVASAAVASGEGIAGTVFSSASPLLVEDLPGEPGMRRHGVLSSVSVPISDSRGNLGVINVGSRSFPARLTDAYLRALGILGSQTALAIRNADAAERSWDLYLENLQALASALEANDPYRKDASARTALLAVALGRRLGLGAEELVSLRIAAILHDVGMGLATGSVGATDRPLSTVDRGLLRAHPKVASDVLTSVPSLERLAPVVRHHHEWYDGDGYDTGLAGESIPVGSRILAVADAYVAMTSPRPYRDALRPDEALEELAAMSGSQFDPEVVEAFARLIEEEPDLAG